MQILQQMRRFNVLLAHRRFGKTYLAIVVLLLMGQRCRWPNPQVHYFSPTYSQSKRIAWLTAKQICAPFDPKYNESELLITLGDIRLQLGSAENPDSNRGIFSDFAVLDEPSQMPSAMFSEVIRPALSDRGGGLLQIGTPKGRHGLFYDSYNAAADLPDWWRGCYTVEDTGLIAPDELKAARRIMSTSEYEQEFMCSWSAAIRGAVWGEEMNKIEVAGQITGCPWEPDKPVHTAWDLGMNDATAIWMYQEDGGYTRFIDYIEYTNTGLPDIVADLKDKPYIWGRHILPHDVKVRSMSTGKSRQQTLYDLGMDTEIAPDIPVNDGIELARSKIRNCWFDRDKCRYGIECLRQYCFEWDDTRGVLRKAPLHNFASHGSDAFRYWAAGFDSYTDGAGWRSTPDYSRIDAGRVI